MERSEKEKQKKADLQFDRQFWLLLVGFLCLVIAIMFLPWALTQHQWFTFDFKNTGNIGDTIGGIVGPFIAVIASVLTFCAFWVQYQANQQQKRDLQVERFESRLFSMLEHHRNNVSEIVLRYRFPRENHSEENGKPPSIRTITIEYRGREAFEVMAVDLQGIYELIRAKNDSAIGKAENEWIQISSDREIYDIAYFIFFYGVNRDGQKLGHEIWPADGLGHFQQCFQLVFEHNRLMKNKVLTDGFYSMGDQLRNPTIDPLPSMHHAPQYHLGFGHYQWLSHSLRNVYSMVEYLDSFTNEEIPAEQRERYARMIRSNLSIPEQIILYYDAISKLGTTWISSGFLKRYRLIRHIPLPMASFYINPVDHPSLGAKNEAGEPMFEWLEIEEQFNQNASATPSQG